MPFFRKNLVALILGPAVNKRTAGPHRRTQLHIRLTPHRVVARLPQLTGTPVRLEADRVPQGDRFPAPKRGVEEMLHTTPAHPLG